MLKSSRRRPGCPAGPGQGRVDEVADAPTGPHKRPVHVVVDSTGLKIFSEGEWYVRQRGVGKRRAWRTIHLAVDETGEDIIGIEVTTADRGDSEVFPDLLAQVDDEVVQVSAAGSYDTERRVPPSRRFEDVRSHCSVIHKNE